MEKDGMVYVKQNKKLAQKLKECMDENETLVLTIQVLRKSFPEVDLALTLSSEKGGE